MAESNQAGNGVMGWIDARLPVTRTFNEHLAQYYAPKNFNVWYYFGSFALLVLVIQIVTGIWLTMHYKPDAEYAFQSVEYIMREVPYGWLIRYMHSTGASFFFLVVYLHMTRALLYGSYKPPRELIWLLGMLIFFALMAEAFMGYLLPWGQMSYWGAQVIISLFGALPIIGDDLTVWIRGDFVVSDATLSRFFSLHVVALPIALLGLAVVHIIALHEVGSNNPDGVEIKKYKNADGIPRDGIPFHPYYTVKDLMGACVFLFVFAAVVFYAPTLGGWLLEKDNFIPADPLQTPEHIMPVWYFTPFYAILRAIPDKLMGVLVMGASVLILVVLPWLDTHPVKSVRYRSVFYKCLLAVFGVTFLVLGWLGVMPATPGLGELGFRFMTLYFFFFAMLVVYSRERSAGYYFTAFGALLLLTLLLDAVRFDPSNLGLMLQSSPIVLAFLVFFLLGPVFKPSMDESKPVPEAVT